MPYEDQYYKGWVSVPLEGAVHPRYERTCTDYAHGYMIHAHRPNAVGALLTSDKLFALGAVRQRGQALGEMSEELRNDEDVVAEAVKQVKVNRPEGWKFF